MTADVDGRDRSLRLGAKDVIDIQVTVKEFASAIPDALQEAGFVPPPDVDADHVPPGFDEVPEDWSKRAAVDLIYFAAEAWAARSDWQPAP